MSSNLPTRYGQAYGSHPRVHKGQTRFDRVLLLVVGLGIIGLLYHYLHRPAPPVPPRPVIELGKIYHILPYSSVRMQVGREAMEGYLIPFLYEDGDAPRHRTRRATIFVPKEWVIRDTSLPENSIVWVGPKTVEGMVYGGARWNPRRFMRNEENNTINPEAPPRR